jgi:polysaccharide deacetylase family protein (PEP-CTERM system associated)
VESTVTNALTIDVEDWFQVSALAPYVARSGWERCECRVERNVERILELLAAHRGTRATFFTLGWIAERYPRLVQRIAAAGHEVASHGYGHERVGDLDPGAFRADVRRAKSLLEDLSGRPVLGYRAPSFSIGRANLWAFDVLAETGHRYSSSVYPVRHDHYGMPEAPRFAYRVPAGIVEVPPSTVAFGGRNFPASGGGFFRLLPYAVSRSLIRRINAHDGASAIFYFHPWELDPGQPRLPGIDAKTRLRHYLNLARTESRLGRLLADFRWGRMDDIFLGSAVPEPAARPVSALS